MKKIVIVSLMISTLLFLTSCASKAQKSKKVEEKPVASDEMSMPILNLSISHSYLTEKNIGETVSVQGLLTQNGDNFVLFENSDSKGRVTFELTVKDKKIKEELKKQTGNTVKVSGKLTAVPSTWTKKITVLKVE
jgi:hypothetical protein